MDNETKELWEILVPTQTNEGKPFRTRFHRVWDEKVRTISGGLTIMPPVTKGVWVDPEGRVFEERMIPVRILCSEHEIHQIAEMTIEYYKQDAVLAYVVGNKPFIKYKDSETEKTLSPSS